MRWFVFKSPYKPTDEPLEIFPHEPTVFQIESLARHHGQVEAVSQEDFEKTKNA